MTVSPEQIVREKLEQASQLLDRYDIDLWLTFVRETSLSKDPALELIYPYDVTWHSAFLVHRRGGTTAIVGRYDADNVERLGAYLHVSCYDQSIRPMLTDAIKRMRPRTIALNFSESDPSADGLTFGMRQTLDEVLAEAGIPSEAVVSSEKFLNSLRGRKTAGEVEAIREAIATTEQLYAEVGRRIRPGATERELGDYLHGRLKALGLETSWHWHNDPAVNTGPDSVVGHAAPSDLKVQAGHLVHFDFGIKQNGFCSDIQRMWYVLGDGETEPPPEVQKTWKIVRGAMTAGFMALKPGVLGWEVDAVAREYLTRHGLPEYLHAFGHNVGRVAHDGGVTLGPRWDRYGGTPYLPVEAGNVFAIELGAQVPGRGWIYLEENVLVTGDGPQWLSGPQTELMVIQP